MDTTKILMEFSRRVGVSGRESNAAAYGAELLGKYGPVDVTPLGSVLCRVRPAEEGQPHLLLDAHIDEIGMVVTTITEDGFLRVGPTGGMDRRLLSAAPVLVHTDGGPVPGVVCSIPPHLSGDESKKNPKVEDIHIDIGMDRDAAEAAVSPGDVVTLQSAPRELLNGLVCGKALDDRAGCAALLNALEFLGDVPLSCGLTVQFSTMEEEGGFGAKTAAYHVKPTHAIAVDVSFAYTPDSSREKCGDLGKGPMIGYAPILNAEMSRDFVRVAEQQGIPFQHEVMGGRTGTNADQIVAIRGGVITGLLSIPQKYMHTPVEIVSVADVEHTGRLIAAYIREKWEGKA